MQKSSGETAVMGVCPWHLVTCMVRSWHSSPTCLSYPLYLKVVIPPTQKPENSLIYVFKIDTLTQASLTDTQLNELY